MFKRTSRKKKASSPSSQIPGLITAITPDGSFPPTDGAESPTATHDQILQHQSIDLLDNARAELEAARQRLRLLEKDGDIGQSLTWNDVQELLST